MQTTSDEDNESIPMFLDMGRQEPYQLKRRLVTSGQTARRDMYCTRRRHNKSSFVQQNLAK